MALLEIVNVIARESKSDFISRVSLHVIQCNVGAARIFMLDDNGEILGGFLEDMRGRGTKR